MKTFLPGSTIGILGGGQLGRMIALAAARLGYKTHVFCQDAAEPAASVSSHVTLAQFDDDAALALFAEKVDVVTLEWENIPVASVEEVQRHAPVFPSPDVLRITQDRSLEKNFAIAQGIGTANFTTLYSVNELVSALQRLNGKAILKSSRFGYDGRGQVRVSADTDASEAWKTMGAPVAILEAHIPFVCEVSVIVACRADGASIAFPVVENIHREQILSETHAPAGLSPAIMKEAEHLARRLAERLNIVGLLAVEMFVLKEPNDEGHRVLLNETAPRPHNSGHWTIDACPCSQFEQLIRAICGLPLGGVTPHSKAVMHNLIGGDWEKWPALLADENACVHLYGKDRARPGRKMGHVTFLKGAW